jgi:hypothetical protein
MMGRHGLEAFGLGLVATLALAGVMASGALGASLNLGDEFYSGEAGFFLIGGAVAPTGLTKETVSGQLLGLRDVLIPSKSVEIACSSGEVTKGFVANEYENYNSGVMKNGGYGSATVLLSGCKVNKINPTTGALEGELKACTEGLNEESSHHITLQGTTFIKKHEGKTYAIVVPPINSKADAQSAEALTSRFSVITFGELCALPSPVTLQGSLAVAMPAADAIKPIQAVDTFSAAGKVEQALLGAKMSFGASPMFMKGEAFAELTGVNSGKAWGAM